MATLDETTRAAPEESLRPGGDVPVVHRPRRAPSLRTTLDRRLRHEEGLDAFSEILLRGNPADELPAALEPLRAATEVDRTALFEADPEDLDAPSLRLIAEAHAPEVPPLGIVPSLRHVAYGEIAFPELKRLLAGHPLSDCPFAFSQGFRAGLSSLGIASFLAIPIHVKGHWRGVLWFDSADPEPAWEATDLGLLRTAARLIGAQMDRERDDRLLAQAHREISEAYEATLFGWATALELRERETAGHCRRVTDLTVAVARAGGLPENQIEHIRRGAMLHDIGKMAIPDSILLKPGPLRDEEWSVMRLHPDYALQMLAPISYLAPAVDIPFRHHERWDGSGYPGGLRGEEIPLPARLFAVVDVWDALTSDRPYRRAWSRERSRSYLRERSGHLFDPLAVELLLQVLTLSG
jgi:HD-GYP domain-containing protein (c-di-GMP phosphodiesterase class II)